MSNLEKLYNNIDRLTDNYEDTEETKKAREEVAESLGKDFFEYEEKIAALSVANEKQGFMCGFQYAVSLLTGERRLQEV